jgi:hypothetical protein
MVQLVGAYLHLTAGCMWHRICPDDEPSSIDGQRTTARNKRR